MDKKIQRKKASYIEYRDASGGIVSHLILTDEKPLAKKKSLKEQKVKHSTKNVNGKVITTITYEK